MHSVAPLVFVAFIACSSVGAVCTLMDCSSGLRIKLSPNARTPWKVQVTDVDTRITRIFDCNAGFPPPQCPGAFFPDFMPKRIHVVTVANGFIQENDFTPTYASHRPNGRNCPPVCSVAEVMVTVVTP